jgi:hypothetical protein
MERIGTGILVVAIMGVVWQFITIRKQVVTGGMIIPSYVAVVLYFSVCVLIVLVFGLSPFHLLWLFFVSVFFGFVSLFLPPFQSIVMFVVVLLAGTKRGGAKENGVPMSKSGMDAKNRPTRSKRKRKKR